MTIKITRGLGGRKDVLVLGVIVVLGISGVLGARQMRHKITAPTGVGTSTLPAEEIIALGEKARGPARAVAYHDRDVARVVAAAVAQRPDETWQAVPMGTIFQVTGVVVAGEEVWLRGIMQGHQPQVALRIHASFLAPYQPVVLDNRVELADVRLLTLADSRQRLALNAFLRNISDQTLSQCVVTCIFQNQGDRPVDTRRTDLLVLPPRELIRFQLPMTDKPYASIALQITYATPDGLRNYLPTVVIKKSSL